MTRALCKMGGKLLIVEIGPAKSQDGKGACPQCGGKTFIDRAGWVECENCFDYALLRTDVDKARQEFAEQSIE